MHPIQITLLVERGFHSPVFLITFFCNHPLIMEVFAFPEYFMSPVLVFQTKKGHNFSSFMAW